MGRKYRRALEEEDVQQRRLRMVEQDELPEIASHRAAETSPHGILNMQRTLGNKAVQRLIVQRAPQPKSDSDASATVVGSITGARHGKFKGNSRVVGHEGKLEFLSMRIEPGAKKMTVELIKRVDELTPVFTEAFQSGESLTTAQFMTIRRTDTGAVETGLTFDFSNGYIAGLQYSTSEGIAYEVITLEFEVKAEKS